MKITKHVENCVGVALLSTVLVFLSGAPLELLEGSIAGRKYEILSPRLRSDKMSRSFEFRYNSKTFGYDTNADGRLD